MSKEEILKYLYYFTSSNIKNKKLNLQDGCGFNLGFLYVETLQKTVEGLVDLYEKEQEKNKNSISKDKIRKDLEICQKVYEEEMKPYQTEYGLNVSCLSKKEKEQLVNKRNCLITQMKTYEMLLEE